LDVWVSRRLQLVFVRRQRKPGTFSEGPSLKQLEHEFLCSVQVSGEEAFAAFTSSESGSASDDGSDDSKQAGYTDSDVEFYVPPFPHAPRHAAPAPAPAPAPFIQKQQQFRQPSAFPHEFGSAFAVPAPSMSFAAGYAHHPTVAPRHPVAERAEADPSEPALADLALPSDAFGVSLDEFVADLAYLEQIDFETIF
jgi:hypothetical protein